MPESCGTPPRVAVLDAAPYTRWATTRGNELRTCQRLCSSTCSLRAQTSTGRVIVGGSAGSVSRASFPGEQRDPPPWPGAERPASHIMVLQMVSECPISSGRERAGDGGEAEGEDSDVAVNVSTQQVSVSLFLFLSLY